MTAWQTCPDPTGHADLGAMSCYKLSWKLTEPYPYQVRNRYGVVWISEPQVIQGGGGREEEEQQLLLLAQEEEEEGHSRRRKLSSRRRKGTPEEIE